MWISDYPELEIPDRFLTRVSGVLLIGAGLHFLRSVLVKLLGLSRSQQSELEVPSFTQDGYVDDPVAPFYFQIYAGEALKDTEREPIHVCLDEEAYVGLYNQDPNFWGVFLYVIEEHS